ncbi:methyltransferase domain-containing protein [Streptomyces sp. NBC_00335]|uniref:methyltransferase domain-containing protein n=1 Tax=unclassified Streptomyces TaxID=2593676 RepID=UPI0022547194|nr:MULTISPECIES: methyltransferase domain-containing protein [unclassified Streptomyces]MCX5403342.1 methyltransferase domain-containing protein [Streptomyces sp. NBC_00086]
MAVLVIGDAPTEAIEAAGLRIQACRNDADDPLPATLTGIDAVVLSPGATPAALPLVGPALAAEVPVLALGEGARLLTEAADTRLRSAGDTTDPVLGGGSAVHGFRVGASAWVLPVSDEADRALLGRFAALVAARTETTATRAFFTPRAAAWEERFAYQTPAYEAAVARMRLRPGQRALDLGCGSGRALPALRALVGARGTVIGVDLTHAMLTAAARAGRGGPARLLLADCGRLPLPAGAVHGIFAAGLLDHLPHPGAALREWARVTAPGGELLLFHPSGRAERAARHGRAVSPDDLLAEPNLRPALEAAGWHVAAYEDAPTHFLTRATR